MTKWRRNKKEARQLHDAYALACSRPVDVRVFGAIADDDEHDNTEAVQLTIDFVVKYGGGAVRIPSGRYLITSTIRAIGDH